EYPHRQWGGPSGDHPTRFGCCQTEKPPNPTGNFDRDQLERRRPRTNSRSMAPRTTKNEPSFDLIWLKFGGASCHNLVKQQQEPQRRLEKPPAREFSYNLDAFLNAARSVGKLLERKRPKKNARVVEAAQPLQIEPCTIGFGTCGTRPSMPA